MRSRSRGGRRAGYKTRVKITRFKFDDHGADWHLEETAFDQLNLLVGVSGVGKTKILEALRRLCRMATGSKTSPGEIEWLLEFEHDGRPYRWEGLTGAKTKSALLEDVSSESPVGDKRSRDIACCGELFDECHFLRRRHVRAKIENLEFLI